jgi:6,7-dimethyl-8-ribityllumazine synthase
MSTTPLKILIVVARFYPQIADHMIAGAKAALAEAGADVDVVEVPGAFEIPAVISMAADSSPVALRH